MRNTSFIMGLVGGIICCLFSTLMLATLAEDASGEEGAVLTMVLLSVFSVLFIVGTSIVLTHGGAGGVIMIVSSSLVFIMAIVLLSIEYFQDGLGGFGVIYISLALMGIVSGTLGYKSRNDPKKSKRVVTMPNMQYTMSGTGQKFCENCGHKMTLDVKYCPKCGSKC